jgi:hypothetical protein
MGIGKFLDRADKAAQDAKEAVNGGVVIAIFAAVIAVAALIIAVVGR